MASEFAPPLKWRHFQTPKRDLAIEQMEDVVHGNEHAGSFAVADGATQTLFAGRWATLLTERFVAEPIFPVSPDEWAEWLKPIRRCWWDEIREVSLPWYAEHKLPGGAGATLVGLCLRSDQTWQALAVGDACLFLWRNGGLVESFPISDPTAFHNRPQLVSSLAPATELLPLAAQGHWQSGDCFLLMTDATAAWFLAETTAQRSPWPSLERLLSTDESTSEPLAEIEQLRQSLALRDDDVTLVLIEV